MEENKNNMKNEGKKNSKPRKPNNDLGIMRVLWAIFNMMARKRDRFHLLKPEELDTISNSLDLCECQRLRKSIVEDHYFKKLKKLDIPVPKLILEPIQGSRRTKLGIEDDPVKILKEIHKYVSVKYPNENWVLPEDIVIFDKKEEEKVEENKPTVKEANITAKRPFGRKQFAIAALLSELGPKSQKEIGEFLFYSVIFCFNRLSPEDLIYREFKVLSDGRIKFVGELENLPYNPKNIIEEPWWISDPAKIKVFEKYFRVQRERVENIIIIHRDDSIRTRRILAKIIDSSDYPIGKPNLANELKAGLVDCILIDAEELLK